MIAAVFFRDMVAGPQRLLPLARAGTLSVQGQTRTSACANGTVSVTTTAAGYTLTAANCILIANDGLVYDGTWVFENQIANQFLAESDTVATIASTTARFGYGAATEQALGGVQIGKCCTGYQANFQGLPGIVVNLAGVGPVVVNGRSDALTVDLPNGRRLAEIRTTDADGTLFAPRRATLATTTPMRATLQAEGDGVRALIDRDGDTVNDRSLFVNWSEFRTAGSTAELVAAMTAASTTLAFPATPVVSRTDQDAVAMRQTVLYDDQMAGTERLMGRSPVDILAAPGTSGTRACATGSVTGNKVSSTSYVLTASNCQLWGTDPLVYDGTWRFDITSNTYAPDGSCAAGSECMLRATIGALDARFGYRVANRDVMRGTQWERKTTAAGATDAYVVFPSVAFTFPQGTFPVVGTSRLFHAQGANGVLHIVAGKNQDPAGTPKRPPLFSMDPIIGLAWMIPTDRGMYLFLDNGAPQLRTFLVPWAEFE